MKPLALGLVLVAIAVLIAACSGGSAGPSASPAAPAASAPAGAIVVVAKDLKFTTAAIAAPAGGSLPDLAGQPGSRPPQHRDQGRG